MITYLQIAIFSAYVFFIIKKFGVLSSISESWYKLEENGNGQLFTFFCWSIGSLMILHGSLFFFLSGAGLFFTGTATSFKLSIGASKIVHYLGAGICIGFALLELGWFYLILFGIGSLILVKKENNIFWIEILAFVLIGFGLLVSL